jgi:hypothetical protein
MTCLDWSSLLPALLTVIGWFAAFGVAVWQYKKVRKQSVNMEVYKQFLEVYTKLALSIANLRDRGWRMRNAMDLIDRLRAGVDKPELISFDLTHISKLEDSFEDMKANLLLLDVWLGAVQKSLPNAADIQSIRDQFKQEFKEPWLDLNIELNKIKISTEFNTGEFEKLWVLVNKTVEGFEQKLRAQASASEAWLLKG